jgi:hypothetical protein
VCGQNAEKNVKRLDKPEYANIILAAAGSRQQAAGSRQQAANSKQQTNMKIFSVIHR